MNKHKIRYYIASFRLRTLPLSLSGILLGSLLAKADGSFALLPFVLAVTTTLCLQILSNLANELGDLEKGTDNADRLGPIRSIQSGALSLQEFKRTIVIFIIFSVISGTILVYTAFDHLFCQDGMIMLLLGAAAIVAAIKYTVGKGAYGYHGLGDLFVFLFFGLLSVCGSYFVIAHQLRWEVFLPAASIGLLSTGVLNLNNMRDIENDRHSGKQTIPVKIGLQKAKYYQVGLITGAVFCMCLYTLTQFHTLKHFLFLLVLPLFILHLKKVAKNQGRELDSQLKVLSLTTLLFALLSGLSQLLFTVPL